MIKRIYAQILLFVIMFSISGCGLQDLFANDFEPPTGRYLTPSGGLAGGPASYRVLLAESDDGLNFEKLNILLTDQADVPAIVVDENGVIYVYYVGGEVGNRVNALAAALSYDNGESWVYKYVNVDGLKSEMADPVDPSVLIMDDGTFRLYFTSQDPANTDYAFTYYADSTDGLNFDYKGEAFNPGGRVLDPSVIKIGDYWHIFGGGASAGKNWHGISDDGASFEFYGYENNSVDGSAIIMSNGLEIDDGYRYFGFDPDGNFIVSLFTSDGFDWEVESGYRLELDRTNTFESEDIKDASAVKLSDGTYLMVYVTAIPE